jgi:hypothetical protein
MLECNSPWLVNLVSTARDDKNIYMLLEAVLGGELFAYLQVMWAADIDPPIFKACNVFVCVWGGGG